MPLSPQRLAALLLLASLALCAHAHAHAHADEHPLFSGPLPPSNPSHTPLPLPSFAPNNASRDPWTEKYAGVTKPVWANPPSFAGLPLSQCLEAPAASSSGSSAYDLAILGIPFDTLTSFRPGARFGPRAIRQASQRMSSPFRKYSLGWAQDAFNGKGVRIVDCWDAPVSPYDPSLAIDQMDAAYTSLLNRPRANTLGGGSAGRGRGQGQAQGHGEQRAYTHEERRHLAAYSTRAVSLTREEHPKIVTLGGDHTVVLPILRSLNRVYGPITVLHFDAHLDTWAPDVSPAGSPTEQSQITHGTFFHRAAWEGLIAQRGNVHAGIRTRLSSAEDLAHDAAVGFHVITTEDIDDVGVAGVLDMLRAHLPRDGPVYLSLDIDVLDPAHAPGTGTLESGGWTARELKRILRGLGGMGLHWVGADVVEVSPSYDGHEERTALVAAEAVFEIVNLLVKGASNSDGGESEQAKSGTRAHEDL